MFMSSFNKPSLVRTFSPWPLIIFHLLSNIKFVQLDIDFLLYRRVSKVVLRLAHTVNHYMRLEVSFHGSHGLPMAYQLNPLQAAGDFLVSNSISIGWIGTIYYRIS